MEQWKSIKGFKNLYKISDHGRILSCSKIVSGKFGSKRQLPDKILSATNNGKGYLVVALYKDGQRYFRKVHRLVAKAFIENPFDLPEVNHKDGDKTNNRPYNLEWSTTKENCRHRQDNGLGNHKTANKAREKAVACFDLSTGKIVNTYCSARIASIEFGCRPDSIGEVARGRKKSLKGYGWKFI